MEHQSFHNLFERRPLINSKTPAVKWFKQWVPQDVVATGGKCLVLKWVTEAQMQDDKRENHQGVRAEPPEPDPTTEVLFLCSYEGCGKTFIDAGALRKHSHIHGERQYVCHYENCGKKFLDSSKLKRHFLIHTGERDFVCPHEGCGKAFSLDFNLRSHMKTHSQENYHICPFQECGKRYAHEYKLKNHIMSHHEKNLGEFPPKYVQVQQPPPPPTKTKVGASSSSNYASSERPYACPYEGCEKAYIHEYKLNLHLRREHPGHLPAAEEYPPKRSNKNNTAADDMLDADAGSDHDAALKRRNTKTHKPSRPKPQLPPTNKRKLAPPAVAAAGKKQQQQAAWPVAVKEALMEEDSEETEEEDRDNGEDGWRYGGGAGVDDDDDDEETEYED